MTQRKQSITLHNVMTQRKLSITLLTLRCDMSKSKACARHVRDPVFFASVVLVGYAMTDATLAKTTPQPVCWTATGATFSRSSTIKVQTKCKQLFNGIRFRQSTLDWMHSNMYNRRTLQSNDKIFNHDIHSAASSSSASSSPS